MGDGKEMVILGAAVSMMTWTEETPTVKVFWVKLDGATASATRRYFWLPVRLLARPAGAKAQEVALPEREVTGIKLGLDWGPMVKL